MFHRIFKTLEYQIAEELVKKPWTIIRYYKNHDELFCHYVHARWENFEINSCFQKYLQYKNEKVTSNYITKRLIKHLIKTAKKKEKDKFQEQKEHQLKMIWSELNENN